MTPNDFIFWLDGFLNANPHLDSLNEEQTKRLKDKLRTVFLKITPDTTITTTPGSGEKPYWVDMPRTYCNSLNKNELDCSSESLVFKFNPNHQFISC